MKIQTKLSNLFLVGAILVLLGHYFVSLAFAINPPKLKAQKEQSQQVRLSISLRGQLSSSLRRKSTLSLERASQPNYQARAKGKHYATIARFFRPIRRQAFIDTAAHSGKNWYRARLTIRRGRRLLSEPIVITIRKQEEQLNTSNSEILSANNSIDLPIGLSQCEAQDLNSMLLALNIQRLTYGLASFDYNTSLAIAAQQHSIKMAQQNLLTHAGWIEEIWSLNIPFSHAAQNIAWYIEDPVQVVLALMQSPGHKANILDSQNLQVGLGCVRDIGGRKWWTQDFWGL